MLAMVPRVSPPPRSRPPPTLKYHKNEYLGKIEYLDYVQYAVTCNVGTLFLPLCKIRSKVLIEASFELYLYLLQDVLI